jgi:hypothetical protein
MTIKTKNESINSPQPFPFTELQLRYFQIEINDAGGFYQLMIQKKAITNRMGMKYITKYRNIDRYRRRYLSGIYEPLKPFYDTEMPFLFWSEMFEALNKQEF